MTNKEKTESIKIVEFSIDNNKIQIYTIKKNYDVIFTLHHKHINTLNDYSLYFSVIACACNK